MIIYYVKIIKIIIIVQWKYKLKETKNTLLIKLKWQKKMENNADDNRDKTEKVDHNERSNRDKNKSFTQCTRREPRVCETRPQIR